MKTIHATLTLVLVICFACVSCDQGTTSEIDEPVPNADTRLSSLVLSAGTLSPDFTAATTAYTANVSNATGSITVTPTASASSAAIEVRVNGGAFAAVPSGSASAALALTVGTNVLDVKVTAENGDSATYTVTVTRALSPDTRLSSLVLSAGTLSPDFAAATTAYTANVSNATESITVTPTASASSAAIEVRVNGGAFAAVPSGSASAALALNAGANELDVKVTAENGDSAMYTVTVTRVLSTDTGLSALTLSAGTLSPDFATATTSYTACVPNATTEITVTPTASASSAAIEVRVNVGTFASVSSGSASAALALNVGTNELDVKVTAENGDSATYTVTVTRIGAVPTLTLDFKYGEDGTSAYSNIYVAWIEDMDGTVIQNLYICNKLLTDMVPPSTVLTNTALPYWNEEKYDPAQIDAVSGATVAKADFTVTRTLTDLSVTKFKVCFETDRSFDENDWFGDQPALLYSVIVDLENPQSSYNLTLEAWTPNEGTIGTLSQYLGTLLFGSLQTETRFITHKKAASTPPAYVFDAEDGDQSATCFVENITFTVE